jgi:twitching motility protein PilT
MQTGGKKGMQTMEQALAELVLRGVVTEEVALQRSAKSEQLLGLLGRGTVEGGTVSSGLRVAGA